MILPLQEIRDLLPAAVVLADPQIPNQSFDGRGEPGKLVGDPSSRAYGTPESPRARACESP